MMNQTTVTAVPVEELRTLVRVLRTLADDFDGMATLTAVQYSYGHGNDAGHASAYRFAADELAKLCDNGRF